MSSGLPSGFDPTAWSSNSGNYPFLTGQPDPLPVPGPPAPRNPQPPQPLPPANPEVNPNLGQLAQANIVSQLANTTPQDPPKTEEPFKIEGSSSSSGGSGGSGGRTGGGGANAGRPSVNSVPPAGLGPLPSGMPPLNETRFLANEVVMQLGMNMSRAQVEELARRNGLEIIASEAFGLLGRTVYRFRITGGGEVRGIIGALQAIGATISAQPSYQFELTEAVAPSDTNRRGDSAQYIVTKLQLPEAHRDRERQEREGRGDRFRDRRPASRPAGRDRGDLRRAPLGRQDRASARHRHGRRDRVAPAPARRRARRAAARGARLRREHRRSRRAPA